MARLLARIGSTSYKHPLLTLGAWILLLLILGGLALSFAKPPVNNFTIPGLPAVTTAERMADYFDDASDDPTATPNGTIVIEAPEGSTLAQPEVAAEVNAFVTELKDAASFTNDDQINNPVMATQGMRMQMTQNLQHQGVPQPVIDDNIAALSPLSEDKTVGTISVMFDAPTNRDIPEAELDAFYSLVDEANTGDLTVTYSGNAFGSSSPSIDPSSEVIGLVVAAIVLIITFASLLAAGLPLISAILGVALGMALVGLATLFTDSIHDMTPALASMIGLAVGIDYSLFILSRFRSEFIASQNAGHLSPKEVNRALRDSDKVTRANLMGYATGTAGSAVVFAGLTVLIALIALTIIGIPFLSSMALAAATTVTIAVLMSLTFLPALAGLFGTRVFTLRLPGPTVPTPGTSTTTLGQRWVRVIRKAPVVFVILPIVILGALAIPAANMQTTMPTDATAAVDTPQRQAYETIEEAFGPGRNSPMIALVEAGDVAPVERQGVYADAVQRFSSADGVVNAQIFGVSEQGDAARIMITPAYDSLDKRSTDLLNALRDEAASFEADTGAVYGITGTTPVFDDIAQQLDDALLPYIAIILVLAFLVLLVAFRSLMVPLNAPIGFALSVAGTFGVTVAVFQDGLFGIISDPQPLLSYLPIMLIGLVFGLAMDYQMFLVSRMREAAHDGMEARDAVEYGFTHGARVVTAAALIMISVFAAFVAQDIAFIKTVGFALAVAIFLDAFVIRMTFIPATMFLLGSKAWALPRWLDKLLPNIDVEGEGLKSDSVRIA